MLPLRQKKEAGRKRRLYYSLFVHEDNIRLSRSVNSVATCCSIPLLAYYHPLRFGCCYSLSMARFKPRKAQIAIIVWSLCQFSLGIGLFIPGFLDFIDNPPGNKLLLSVNLCLAAQETDEGAFRYVGIQGECPEAPEFLDDALKSSPQRLVVGNYFAGRDYPSKPLIIATKAARGNVTFSVWRTESELVFDSGEVEFDDYDPR